MPRPAARHDKTGRSRLTRLLMGIAFMGAVPLLAACPKKPEPVVDAAPPPPPPDTGPVDLVPMVDDAGPDGDADAEASTKKWVGTPTNTNVARLKQCCGQLRTQAKTLGASPEAAFLTAAAGQCENMASQAGPTGNAPELGALRMALQGRNVPPVCAGF